MRFLFFIGGSFRGGMETAFLSLMKALAAQGHQPTAIVSGWTDGEVPLLLDAAGIPHHEVFLGRFYVSNLAYTWQTVRHMPAARRQLRSIADEVSPDWVVSPDVQVLLLSASIFRTRRALFLHNAPERLMRHRWAGRVLDRYVDRVLCCSQFIAECARTTPVAGAKVAVVPNGVPLPTIAAVPQRSPVRLAIVGRVVEQKQHMVLLEAFAQLKRRGVPCVLDIVGTREGEFCDAVEARIAALGLGEQVRWKGFVADPDQLYANVDVLVAPAIDEPFGLTVAEAGAYGLPVVAARSGAFPELIEDDRTGLLFTPRDSADLARCLERLVLDAAVRRQLGLAGRQRMASIFTVEAMARHFLEACATSR